MDELKPFIVDWSTSWLDPKPDGTFYTIWPAACRDECGKDWVGLISTADPDSLIGVPVERLDLLIERLKLLADYTKTWRKEN